MTNVDKLDDDKVMEIAKTLGYELKIPKKVEENKTRIFELDLRDMAEFLFF